MVVAAGSAYAVYETRTSTLQAKLFAGMMKDVHYRMDKGASNAIRFPSESPYDARLGYSHLPAFLAKLQAFMLKNPKLSVSNVHLGLSRTRRT